jgi:dihydrolipoamide dehydrogenase
MENFDVIIIGGGPAGYCAAERVGHAKLRTLLIEKGALGGVCLNEGCIPTKTFLHSAKLFDYARGSEKYGVFTEGARLEHPAVLLRKNKVVKTLTDGVSAKLKHNGVVVDYASAQIQGRTAQGFIVKAGEREYCAQRILIAAGSQTSIPPIKGLKEGLERGFVLTNREILDLKEIPQSLVVIGGGVIGLEMASYFNSAGSHVTVLELLNKIAGSTDGEISKILQDNCEKKGIRFKLGCKVSEVGATGVVCEINGTTCHVPADKVLLSSGRQPATRGLGLESIGVLLDRDAIVTDENMRTNISGVYAAGDVNGKYMLAHTAYREAEVAVNHMLGRKDRMRYNAIPSVIYTNPEVACVGETEETARQKGMDIDVVKLSMRYSGRYLAENEGGDGIAKFIIDRKHRQLTGVHMIGSYVSEIIFGAALMIETEMRTDDIRELVFPHPTVCEIIREGVFEYKGGN